VSALLPSLFFLVLFSGPHIGHMVEQGLCGLSGLRTLSLLSNYYLFHQREYHFLVVLCTFRVFVVPWVCAYVPLPFPFPTGNMVGTPFSRRTPLRMLDPTPLSAFLIEQQGQKERLHGEFRL
jgi:hypothetical protein